MTDGLTDAERERLCKVLGFEEIRYGLTPATYVWPPIDTDPAWAVKAMEAVGDYERFFTMTKGFIHGRPDEWGVEYLTEHSKDGQYVGTAKEFPLALCGALLAALDAGEAMSDRAAIE